MSVRAMLVWYLLGSGPSATAAAEEAILPPDGYRQAWKKSGSPRVFTSADLYGYIDGGAEIFFEFGFEQLAVQPYTGELKSRAAPALKAQLRVEIYRMSDPVAAAGIYLLKCGKETPDPSFKDRHTINRFQLTFKRDRYFVLVNSIDGSAAARPAMLDFGRFIAGRLPPETPLHVVQNLPQEGLIEGSVRLARGPFALQSIYTLGEGDILQLRPGRTAVAARYRDDAGEYTRIAADYRTPESSRKTFAGLRRNLDSYLKVEDESRDSFVFKDYAGRYGKAALSGSVITILVNLSERP